MCKNCAILLSLPAWEWGLKCITYEHPSTSYLVTPCVGVGIEIFYILNILQRLLSLPAWECGLKSCRLRETLAVKGVWIEILIPELPGTRKMQSLPAWECGLKFGCQRCCRRECKSLPAWECGLKYVG